MKIKTKAQRKSRYSRELEIKLNIEFRLKRSDLNP